MLAKKCQHANADLVDLLVAKMANVGMLDILPLFFLNFQKPKDRPPPCPTFQHLYIYIYIYISIYILDQYIEHINFVGKKMPTLCQHFQHLIIMPKKGVFYL
jgi:hypothetical protein